MEQYYLIKSIKQKKAQAWSLDAIIAILIFFSGIAILFFYAINYSDELSSTLDNLLNQGNTASELLLTDNEVGIVSNNIINKTLLDNFYTADYNLKRRELGITDNFYFTLPELEVNGNPTEYIGVAPFIGNKNSIKIERIVVYNNKPVKLDLYVWK